MNRHARGVELLDVRPGQLTDTVVGLDRSPAMVEGLAAGGLGVAEVLVEGGLAAVAAT